MTDGKVTSASPIDPTENVKSLVAADKERGDDLRELSKELFHAEIRVLTVQVDALEKRMILRAEHAKEIRLLETERVNAIRQVDVLAGNTAADRALVAIQTLATQTTAERETLRNLVTTSAATLAAQNAADLARINEAISALQKSSYEGAGKQAVSDPMMAELVAETKALRVSMAGTSGQSTGAKKLWFIIAAVIAVLGFLTTEGIVLAGIVLYVSRK